MMAHRSPSASLFLLSLCLVATTRRMNAPNQDVGMEDIANEEIPFAQLQDLPSPPSSMMEEDDTPDDVATDDLPPHPLPAVWKEEIPFEGIPDDKVEAVPQPQDLPPPPSSLVAKDEAPEDFTEESEMMTKGDEETLYTKDADTCHEEITALSLQISERIDASFGGDCNIEEEWIAKTEDGGFHLSEEGRAAVCSRDCQRSEVLTAPFEGVGDILTRCASDPEIRVLTGMIPMHEVIDRAWQECPKHELEDDNVDAVAHTIPERGRIKQMKLNIKLKEMLGYHKVDCEILKGTFKIFDYRRLARITMDDIDAVLNKLDDDQKNEAKKKMEWYFQACGCQYLTFTRLVNTQLGFKEATQCAREYAKGK